MSHQYSPRNNQLYQMLRICLDSVLSPDIGAGDQKLSKLDPSSEQDRLTCAMLVSLFAVRTSLLHLKHL